MDWSWAAANWFGILSLLAGLTFSITVYYWQKKDKRPCYSKRNIVIIEKAKSTFPALVVHYKGFGEDLDNLSVAVVAIWNAGRETIHGSDIATAAPLVVNAGEGTKILGASVVQQNNPASKASCEYSKSGNCVKVAWEYLDCKQGLVLEVLHTGVSAAAVRVEGTFKGAGKITEHRRFSSFSYSLLRKALLHRERAKIKRRFRNMLMLVFSLVYIAFPACQIYSDYSSKAFDVIDVAGVKYGTIPTGYYIRAAGDGWAGYRSPLVGWGLLVCGLLFLSAWLWFVEKPHVGPPPNLDKFDDHLLT